MKLKNNCWEVKNCGREPNGLKEKEFGACSASIDSRLNSIHGGKNGGRACWVIAGTLCGGKVQGIFASKLQNCFNCDFYKTVHNEEGTKFKSSGILLEQLQ